MDVTWLETEEILRSWLACADGDILAVDTESDWDRVCLIQLATSEEIALVDPLKVEQGMLQPLWRVFADESRPLLFHAGSNDLEALDREWGIEVNHMLDTRIAARFLGARRNGLDWLIESRLGHEVPSGFGRFDWSQRPLPDRVLEYAATDVSYLHDLIEQMRETLEPIGWWEPVRQQCEKSAREAVYHPEESDPQGWRTIECGPNLEGEGRRALRELYQWRRELCMEERRPPDAILNDDGLAHLAHHRPMTREALERVSPVSNEVCERYSEALLEAIQRAEHRSIPEPRRPHTSSSFGFEAECRYEALRSWRNSEADALTLPPEFIATNEILASIARDPPETLEDLERYDELLPWHRERLGDAILEVIREANDEDEG